MIPKCTSEKKEPKRDKYVTGMLVATLTGGYLMAVYASREPFYFGNAVPSSTRRPTTVKNWFLTALQ